MELEIFKQNLALLSQKRHKFLLRTFKCSLTSPGEPEHPLAASQLIAQRDLEQEINATSNKLQEDLSLRIPCTFRPSLGLD